MGHLHCLGELRRRIAPANAICASTTKKSASIAPPPPLRSLLVLLLSFVGGPATLALAGALARVSSVIFATKASTWVSHTPPPITGFSAFTVGKLGDCVCPVTYAAPVRSTVMRLLKSFSLPPKYVEWTRDAPFGLSFDTNASLSPPEAGCNAFTVGKS